MNSDKDHLAVGSGGGRGWAYLVTTLPDYEGFSVVEVHLDEAAAKARVDAANSYADSAPEFPDVNATDAEYDAFSSQATAWSEAHPFGPEVAGGSLQERYRVVRIPLGLPGSPHRGGGRD